MGSVDHSSPEQHNMKAFACISTLLAAASAAPQFLAGHGLGHGVVAGHGLAHGVVGHGLAHGVVGHGLGHAVAHAAPLIHAAPVAHHAVGYAAPDLAEVSPYTYNYGVADEYSGAAFSQSESNDGTGVVEGSYQVNLPDGRIQTVNYHANDIDGYVAELSYSGTAAYPEAVPVAHHAVAHAAPLVHAVAHPVAHHAVAHPVAVAHAAPVVHAGHGLVGHGLAGHGLVGHGLAGHGLVGHGVSHLG